MRKLLLLVFTLALMVGCGGDGNDNGFDERNIAENFASRFVSALNSDDVDRVAPLISANFYEDCFDRRDFLDSYEQDIRDGFRYNLEILDVWDEEFLDDNEVRFMIRIRDRDTGATDEFPVYIRRENGTWRMYGNQDCNRSSGQSTQKPASVVQFIQKD
ncbi:MAG TPA: nuclear transport factor 2 family protein [Fimbriimonas sp.]